MASISKALGDRKNSVLILCNKIISSLLITVTLFVAIFPRNTKDMYALCTLNKLLSKT